MRFLDIPVEVMRLCMDYLLDCGLPYTCKKIFEHLKHLRVHYCGRHQNMHRLTNSTTHATACIHNTNNIRSFLMSLEQLTVSSVELRSCISLLSLPPLCITIESVKRLAIICNGKSLCYALLSALLKSFQQVVSLTLVIPNTLPWETIDQPEKKLTMATIHLPPYVQNLTLDVSNNPLGRCGCATVMHNICNEAAGLQSLTIQMRAIAHLSSYETLNMELLCTSVLTMSHLHTLRIDLSFNGLRNSEMEALLPLTRLRIRVLHLGVAAASVHTSTSIEIIECISSMVELMEFRLDISYCLYDAWGQALCCLSRSTANVSLVMRSMYFIHPNGPKEWLDVLTILTHRGSNLSIDFRYPRPNFSESVTKQLAILLSPMVDHSNPDIVT